METALSVTVRGTIDLHHVHVGQSGNTNQTTTNSSWTTKQILAHVYSDKNAQQYILAVVSE